MTNFIKNLSPDQRRVGLVIALNIAIVIIESTVGVISGSLALLSDAWHNLSDVLALIVTAIALGLANRPASAEMTYGYVRSEMMATFINAAFLSLLMIWVAVEAIDRLLHPMPVDGWLTMITAGIALIVNTASAIILGGHTHVHTHEDDEAEEAEHDLNVRAAFWHMASDAILSLAVVLGGGAMILWGIPWIDSVLSLVFAAVILIASGKLLKRSFESLIDRADPKMVEKLSQIVMNHPMVCQTHDIHLSHPSSKERYFSAHIILDEAMSLKEVETVIETLRHDLSHAGATHILLQPETAKYDGGNEQCNRHIEHHH
ncbi:cation diffusion facilitator family transporter [Sulfuricurvum sp.]|uniref:cation diffusion facilitator family transporter n=1 Tax=Sulfuricurvum sp. TaxID=2025608 RepID=UPI00262A81F5|nr:cation diffusion facilitator family transporter [Sulfuricurvum sp.]MDD2781532.1 cation diffusion facilitator family transporter [Sulfuricurvum sp.]